MSKSNTVLKYYYESIIEEMLRGQGHGDNIPNTQPYQAR